jgi:hypothetical protein
VDQTTWRAGDVVVQRSPDAPALRRYAAVIDDGVTPAHWNIGGEADAEAWAAEWVAGTKGTIHRIVFDETVD